MIVGESFIWVHLGKTGGKTNRMAIELIEDEKLEKIYKLPDHHYGVEEYEKKNKKSIGSRRVIVGFRQLYTWIQSFHMQNHNHRSEELIDLERNGLIKKRSGQIIRPDELLLRYIGSESNIENITFLRVEYLEEDFLNAFEKNVFSHDKLSEICKVKVGAKDYYRTNFSSEEIKTIYDNNPIWKKIEENIYRQEDLVVK